MPRTASELDRFLRAVHRRWVAVRVAESVGLAVLGGCVLALAVLPILLWRGEPALPVVLTSITAAALAGCIAGVVRRPDLVSAAAEADRQLQLADLLCTALLTRARAPADPWAMSVVAIADARCRALAPGAVMLNRFGGRTWGGIGLMAALVLTLGLMSANPHPSAAVADAPNESLISSDRARQAPPPLPSARLPDEPQPVPRDPKQPGKSADARESNDSPNFAGTNDQAARSASATDGGGAGLATSLRESDASRSPPAASRGASPTTPDGVRFGGGGAPSAGVDHHDDAPAGATVAARDDARAGVIPAWQSPAWPAARERARSAVRDGRLPDAYRDLVREYFEVTPDE